MEKYLVMDWGGTYIKYALMDEEENIIEQGKVKSPRDSLESLLDAAVGVAAPYLDQVTGVAISMPGRIDTANGIAHTGGSFMFIRETPMAELLSERMNGLPVVLANDGKCAANAENESGSLKDESNAGVIVLGTGIGGGIILNGEVWMGSTSAAGELSFFPFDAQRFIESAGMESMNALWATNGSTSSLCTAYSELTGKEHTGMSFFEDYDNGVKEAQDLLEQFGLKVAAGIYGVQAVLDLDAYAIGGGISARPEVTQAVREGLDRLYEKLPFTPFKKPEIVGCTYRNDANLIGALHFLMDQKHSKESGCICSDVSEAE